MTGTSMALPLNEKPLNATFPQLQVPSALLKETMRVYLKDAWHNTTVGPFWETRTLRRDLPDLAGSALFPPTLLSLSNTRLLIYQPKTGMAQVLTGDDTGTPARLLPKRGRPIRIGEHVLWLNLHHKDQVNLTSAEDPWTTLDSKKIDKLHYYSKTLLSGDTLFLLLFDLSWQKALDSWSSGLLNVEVRALTIHKHQLVLEDLESFPLAMTFHLASRPGGSLKLNAEPRDPFGPIHGETGYWRHDGSQLFLTTTKGVQAHPLPTAPVAVFRQGTTFWLFDALGQRLTWEKDEPKP
jgi:hypothetical protein